MQKSPRLVDLHGTETIAPGFALAFKGWTMPDTLLSAPEALALAAQLRETNASALALREALQRRQKPWGAVPIKARLKVLRRFRRRLWRVIPELLRLIPDHAPADVMTAEILPLIAAIRFLEREAVGLLKERSLSLFGRPFWLSGLDTRVRRRPLGAVLIIAPGNYPLMLPGIQVVQALAAGNAVALKPAPGRTALLARFVLLLEEAGLPDGVLKLIPEEDGPSASAAGYDLIILTGSEATGREVARAAAETATPTIMELSGADPVFVLPCADLALVARALHFGLTLKQGATCIAPRRVFIDATHKPVLLALLRHLLDKAPIRSSSSGALDALVGCALEIGVPVLHEGGATILSLTSDQASLADQDVFAPWLALITVRDMAEALTLERGSRHVLGASIFGSRRDAWRLARQIGAGTITVNDLIVPSADPRLSFGGSKCSGHGVTRGREGLLAMTRPVSVSTRRWNALHLTARIRVLHARFNSR